MNDIAKKLLSALDKAIGIPPQNMATKKPAPAPAVSEPSAANNQTPAPFDPSVHKRALKTTEQPPRPNPDPLPNFYPSPATLRCIGSALAEEGIVLASPEELAELKRLDAEWTRLSALIESHCAARAKDRYTEHLADLAKRAAAGDSSIQAGDAWSLDDFKEDHESRRRAIKTAMRDVSKTASEVAAPLFARFAVVSTKLADSLEPGAKALCERFSLPYHPPLPIAAIRKCAYLATKTDTASLRGLGRPAGMVGWLPL